MLIGPKYKICKRLGGTVFEKCQTQKFQISEARSAKNKKKGRRGGNSDFQRQLLEKQKLRLSYGLTEKQFKDYITKALEAGKGAEGANPAAILFGLLESRLDSIAYRMGLAPTRRAARQMVSHGHLTVNGRRVTIPSYRARVGDAVSVREGSRTSTMFANASERLKEYSSPKWVAFDAGTLAGSLTAPPESPDAAVADIQAVFEYYTR